MLLCSMVALARADRPPEALAEEAHEADEEHAHLVKRADALAAALVDRQRALRRKLRTLYKLSQGGYVRLLLGAESPGDLFVRRNAASRIIGRDVGELTAVHGEMQELSGLREALRETAAHAEALLEQAKATRPSGLSAHGSFLRPVERAPALRPFGPYRDLATGMELSRDGIDLACVAGEVVRAPASGTVRSVGDAPGLGPTIVMELEGGWLSLLGHLGAPRVHVGETLSAGDPVATCAAPFVELQLAQDGAWLDPEPFLSK